MKTRDFILSDAYWNGIISYESHKKLFYRQTMDKLYYNLSEEEIQALMNEIKEEANGNTSNQLTINGSGNYDENPNQLDFNYKPGYDFTIKGFNSDSSEPSKPVCHHEWKNYLGLSESFDYCTKCGIKK